MIAIDIAAEKYIKPWVFCEKIRGICYNRKNKVRSPKISEEARLSYLRLEKVLSECDSEAALYYILHYIFGKRADTMLTEICKWDDEKTLKAHLDSDNALLGDEEIENDG